MFVISLLRQAVHSAVSEVIDLSFNYVLLKYIIDNVCGCSVSSQVCSVISLTKLQNNFVSIVTLHLESIGPSPTLPTLISLSHSLALNQRASNALAKTFEGKVIIKSFPPSY